MLEWHRREEKAPWWEYFRLVDLSDDELLEERSALAGLEFVARVGGTDRCPVHQYRFPQQDSDVRDDDPLRAGDGDHVGTVESIDVVGRTVEIKKNGAMADMHPSSVFIHRVIPAEEQAAALLRLGRWVADHDVDADGAFRAGRDLLLRRAPRREASIESTPLVRDGESTLDAAKRVALELDRGVLAIQGPPGAGKTFTGARMICELVRAGKKVGITALSHKVIRNLLDEAVEIAEQQRLLIRCTQKVKDKPAKWDGDPIREVGTNKAVVDQLASGEAQVGAGTSWLWAREEMSEAVDVLFVDEAGQMSLANVLAVSQAAKSVVLLGDPQQLEQPLQGSHPDGTEASALHHLLGDRKTIGTDAGLFLPETWRLAPSICSFTSSCSTRGACVRATTSPTNCSKVRGHWLVPACCSFQSCTTATRAPPARRSHAWPRSGSNSPPAALPGRTGRDADGRCERRTCWSSRPTTPRWVPSASDFLTPESAPLTSFRGRRHRSSSTRWPRPPPTKPREGWSSSTASTG